MPMMPAGVFWITAFFSMNAEAVNGEPQQQGDLQKYSVDV
jgi:hypothetical protein